MIKTLEKTGKTEEDAIVAALEELNLERDDVSVEIVERSKSGFFGIGASPAVVRVSYDASDEIIPEVKDKVSSKQTKKSDNKPESSEVVKKELPKDEKPEYAAIRTFLNGLLEHMGVSADIEIAARKGGGIDVKLTGDKMGSVIGRRGETLDAIQHLTNYAVNHGNDKHLHINVDAEEYRAKREDSLIRLAEKMADKAIKYKRSMALEPMNSYERHVIHTALQDHEGVTTSSSGEEPNRRVVVTPVKTENEEKNKKPAVKEWA